MARQDGSQHPSRNHPAQQLNTQIFAAICFLSPCPSWARLTPPGPRNAGICSCLKCTSANLLACSKRREMGGGKTALSFASFWVFGGFVVVFFLKEGLLHLRLSFCSCSVWKVLLQLALVTGKRASSPQQNKGAVSSFFFYSRVLRKAFLQEGCRGKAGARSPRKPLATTRAEK